MERQFSKIMKGKGKIASYLELGRFWNGVIAGFIAVFGALLAGTPNTYTLAVSFFAILFTYFVAAVANDIADYDCDQINMPYRPLETEEITLKESYAFMLLSAAIALAISFFVSLSYLLVIAAMLIAGLCYSLKPFDFKNRGFAANIWLSFLTIFLSAYSGFVLAANSLVLSMEALSIISSLTITFIFVNLLKDFKDYIGDSAVKKKTAGVKYGLAILSKLTFFSIPLYILTVFLINSYFLKSYIFIMISLAGLAYYSNLIYKLYKNPSIELGEHVWSKARAFLFVFLIILISFLLASRIMPLF